MIERLLARPVTDATQAVWGFTNRTDIVDLAGGDRVVVQRCRRRQDADYLSRDRARLLDRVRGAWPCARPGSAAERPAPSP